MVEKALVAIDEYPWHGLYRIAIGFLLLPAWGFLIGGALPGWTLVLWLVTVLLSLRLAPVVARRVVPFSNTARSIWTERRQFAARYDSYQWQKLFWLGLGLMAGAAVYGRFWSSAGLLALALTVSGGLGFVTWRRRKASLRR